MRISSCRIVHQRLWTPSPLLRQTRTLFSFVNYSIPFVRNHNATTLFRPLSTSTSPLLSPLPKARMPSTAAMLQNTESLEFPFKGLLPKEETQVAQFLKKFPEYDGRGTVVAILDTGVDPGAPGMQITSDGKKKVIDLVDCTGSGDVPLSAPVSASTETIDGAEQLVLTGLSGRKLILNKQWVNPTSQWRLGLKHSSELFPKAVIERLKKDRKDQFSNSLSTLLTAAQQKVIDFEKATPNLNEEQQLVKTDLKARYDLLKDFLGKWEDPGWIFDCVVYHDGAKWRAVIDTSESGDLRYQPTLANYRDEHQYHKFGEDSMLNFSVNIYDKGEMLSIVTLAGSHGTHVGAISAANHPENPILNGVAPGAQIVSLKIGDTRLGSMETGTGLVRAAIHLARSEKDFGYKIDTANMSYGEATAVADFGRFVDLLKDDVINEKGVMFVSSAGNNGPALTTVGAAGGTSSHVLSVGAFVTGTMVDAEYALLERGGYDMPYTWSSRGPVADGDVGVDIYAPGAAITGVPQFTIQPTQLMNGTSMSSPNACGCVSVLISACKQAEIPYSPYRLTRAIKNTAKDVQDPLGVGFIQVEESFNWLNNLRDASAMDVTYDVSVPERNGRGIYLRDPTETHEINQYVVSIQPRFMNNKDPSQNVEKLKLDHKCVLKSTAKWAQAPDFLVLNNGGRAFNVKIDPSGLKPGLHTAQIIGYDPAAPEQVGPLFKVPITICKPLLPQVVGGDEMNGGGSYIRFENLTFQPGKIERRFISVPLGANYAELVVRAENRPTPARFIVHMIQLEPHSRYTRHEHEYAFNLTSNGSISDEHNVYNKSFSVLPGVTMELCLAQFWSSLGDSTVSVEMKFHGLQILQPSTSDSPNGGLLYLNSGNDGVSRLDVMATLRKEEVVPSVSLDTLRRFIRPKDFQISPLKERDVLPDDRQIHQLSLTYEFKSPCSGDVSITPRFPKVNNYLYDAVFENAFLIVFDNHKRVLSYQDIYPKSVKLTSGDGPYTVKLQVTSRQPVEILEKLQQMVLVLDVALAKPVSLPTFWTHADLLGASSPDSSKKRKILSKGERTPLFVGHGESPKDAKQGDMLLGELKVLPNGKKVDGGLFSVVYVIPPAETKKEEGTGKSSDEKEKDPSVAMEEAVRDLKITWIKKMKTDEEKAKLVEQLQKDFPGHIPLMQSKLEVVADSKLDDKVLGGDAEKGLEGIKAVRATVDEALALIDQVELAKWFAVKHDLALEKEKKEKEEMEKKKKLMLHAFFCRAKSTMFEIALKQKANASVDELTALRKVLDSQMEEYQKWAASGSAPLEQTDSKYMLLYIFQQRQKGFLGNALKTLNKFLGESSNVSGDAPKVADYKKANSLKEELLAELNWDLWKQYEFKTGLLKFPKDYANF